jgi:hypothetical protein
MPTHNITFFLEHAGELRIFLLRRKKGEDPVQLTPQCNLIHTILLWITVAILVESCSKLRKLDDIV